MDLTVSFHTRLNDKLFDLSHQSSFAKNFIMKTIVRLEVNAAIVMISEPSLAFITQWENVNLLTIIADFLMKRKYK